MSRDTGDPQKTFVPKRKGWGRGGSVGHDYVFSKGDWKCQKPDCGNMNFAKREECNRCSTARPRSIWVGDLPPNFDNESLAEAFSQFGSVEKATVAVSGDNGKSKGYGHVEFASGRSAANAYGLAGTSRILTNSGLLLMPLRVQWWIKRDTLKMGLPRKASMRGQALGSSVVVGEGTREHLLALEFAALRTQYEKDATLLKSQLLQATAQLRAKGAQLLKEQQRTAASQSMTMAVSADNLMRPGIHGMRAGPPARKIEPLHISTSPMMRSAGRAPLREHHPAPMRQARMPSSAPFGVSVALAPSSRTQLIMGGAMPQEMMLPSERSTEPRAQFVLGGAMPQEAMLPSERSVERRAQFMMGGAMPREVLMLPSEQPMERRAQFMMGGAIPQEVMLPSERSMERRTQFMMGGAMPREVLMLPSERPMERLLGPAAAVPPMRARATGMHSAVPPPMAYMVDSRHVPPQQMERMFQPENVPAATLLGKRSRRTGRGDRSHRGHGQEEPFKPKQAGWGRGGSVGKGYVKSKGDWLCPKAGCGNMNFGRRTECNRCDTPRPQD